jgi:type I restriction enzyme, R subunit
MTPEEKARQQIDAMLTASGWAVQTKDKINLSASRGVAVAELSFKTGEPDYTLFADAKAIATVEAKPEGETLAGVEEQSTKYVSGVPFGLPALSFCYESTGADTNAACVLPPHADSVFRELVLCLWHSAVTRQATSRLSELHQSSALVGGLSLPLRCIHSR